MITGSYSKDFGVSRLTNQSNNQSKSLYAKFKELSTLKKIMGIAGMTLTFYALLKYSSCSLDGTCK